MRGILFGALAVIATLIGGTITVVVNQTAVTYHAAVDHCHDAGGAWVPNGGRSYSGTCLRTPQTPPRGRRGHAPDGRRHPRHPDGPAAAATARGRCGGPTSLRRRPPPVTGMSSTVNSWIASMPRSAKASTRADLTALDTR